jgi:hypothetical protein
VAAAVDFVVQYGLENRDLSGITHIGIDEIARRKGHNYLTNVYDLGTRKLIWSGEGRSEQTLRQFFEYLGPEKAKSLQGICFYVGSSCQALFLYFHQFSDFIPCNSIAGMVPVREWAPG